MCCSCCSCGIGLVTAATPINMACQAAHHRSAPCLPAATTLLGMAQPAPRVQLAATPGLCTPQAPAAAAAAVAGTGQGGQAGARTTAAAWMRTHREHLTTAARADIRPR